MRSASAVRFTPEIMSPAMISHMALVRARPGTKTIRVPMVMASRFCWGVRFTRASATREAMAAPNRVWMKPLKPSRPPTYSIQTPTARPQTPAYRLSSRSPPKNAAKKPDAAA